MVNKTDVEFSGVIWSSREVEKIIAEETADLLDSTALSGEADVKSQLYPGHGVVTGYLRESVTGTRIDALSAVIDAGEVTQGSNVIYANFIEGLYNMFANTSQRINRMGLGRKLREKIAGRLNG